jgi:hypothetical protein
LLLSCNQDLLRLLLDCSSQPVEGATSWTPDWVSAKTPSWIDDDYLYELRPPTHASDYSLPKFRLSSNALELSVFGIQPFDASISFVSDEIRQEPQLVVNENENDAEPSLDDCLTDEFRHNINCLGRWMYEVFKSSNVPLEFDIFPHLLFETCVAKALTKPAVTCPLSWTEFMHDLSFAYSTYKSRPSSNTLESSDSDFPQEVYLKMVERLRKDTSMYKFYRKVISVGNGPRVFCTISTSKRGYLGTGLPGMRPGDIVALASGVSLPLVLRRSPTSTESEQKYLVVGPIFISGMMKGELWGNTQSKLDKFILE